MKKLVNSILMMLTIFSLFGCGNSIKDQIDIKETPAKILESNLVDYADPNGCFTAKIPEGWNVTTAGYDMMYWIRIYDPNSPDLQVFTLLKTECLLKDQNSKNFYLAYRDYSLYTMFADMIVAGSVEDFYANFMEFCSFMSTYESTYNGFEYPQISQFEVIEKYPLNSYLAAYALDDALIHANFVDAWTQEKCDGMFSGTLCNGFESNGVGLNMMYNINGVTAPYGLFDEYESLLTTIISSIAYADEFVSTTITDNQIKAQGAAALNKTLQETSDIITQGWNARQATYDTISEKWSDAILGYERVYDVETNEVYKTTSDFLEIDGVDRYYKPITDDMYSLPVAGYIELK